jgi:PAS domain S-box-containing protein
VINVSLVGYISRLFEPVLDAIADPILIVTDKGKALYANASARNCFDENGSLDIRSLDGTPIGGPEWWRSRRDVTIGAERERFRLQSNRIDDEHRFLITLTPLRYSENEARLRAATDLAGLGLYEWNPRTNALYWDERVREMFGVGAHAPVSVGLFMGAVHPDHRALVQQRIDASVDPDGPGTYEAEYRIVGIHTGVERWVATRGQTFFEGKVPVRFVGVARDITAQKQAEIALRVSEERMRLAMQSANMESWIVDLGTFDMASTMEEHAKRVHPDDLPRFQQAYASVLRGESDRMEIEYRSVRPSGEAIWVHAQGNVFRSGEAETQYLIGVIQDITAMKETERELESRVAQRTAELRKSNETIRALIDASAVAIITVDRADHVQTWNAAAEQMFGWSASEVIGRSMPNIPAQPGAAIDLAVARVFEGVAPLPFDMVQRRRDQTELDVNLSLAPLRDADGKIRSYIAIMQDITDRKRLERERERLMRRIVDTQEEERRRIARELHDEMGQHLTSLKMGIESLWDESGAPVIAHLASVIARIDESIDRMSLELRPGILDDVGLEAAVGALASQFSRESGIGVDIHAESLRAARLPDAIETMFYRLLQEGLTNVWKHSGATTVSVIFDRRNDSVQMIIEDNGRGFRLDTLPAHHARNRFGVLGMRERASLAGGTFHIESSPGSGTSLFVRVPLP